MFIAFVELSSEEDSKDKARVISEIFSYKNILALQTLEFSYKEVIGEPLAKAVAVAVAEYLTRITKESAKYNKRKG